MVNDVSAVEGQALRHNVRKAQETHRLGDGFVTPGNTDAKVAENIAPLNVGPAPEGDGNFKDVVALDDFRQGNGLDGVVHVPAGYIGGHFFSVEADSDGFRIFNGQLGAAHLDLAVKGKAERYLMGDFFLFDNPGLGNSALAVRPTELFTADIVGDQELLHGVEGFAIKRIFGHVKQEYVRLAKGDRHAVRNLDFFHRHHGRAAPICIALGFIVFRRELDEQAVVVEKFTGDDGPAVFVVAIEGLGLAGQGIIQNRRVQAFQVNKQVLLIDNILVVGLGAVRDEEPQLVAVLTKLMQQVLRIGAVAVADVE